MDGQVQLLLFSSLVVLLLALVAAYATRTRWIRWLHHQITQRAPIPVRRHGTRLANFLIPSWRSSGLGRDRTPRELEERLAATSAKKKIDFCALGGVYLDLLLRPVTTTSRGHILPSEINELDLRLGGSAIYVAKFMQDRSSRYRVRLVSMIGKDRAWASEIKSQMRHPALPRTRLVKSPSQSGTAIHLLDNSDSRIATLNHAGALKNLTWSSALKHVQRALRHGSGVLYISSVFRTTLHSGIVDGIRGLSPSVLVVVDHGRLLPADSRAVTDDIERAFRQGYIDVYIATYDELISLAELRLPSLLEEIDPRAEHRHVIEAIARSNILPRVTVIRGEVHDNRLVAVTVIDGFVDVMQYDGDRFISRNRIGSKSSFNAAFIDNLVGRDSRGSSLPVRVKEATLAGLAVWAAEDISR